MSATTTPVAWVGVHPVALLGNLPAGTTYKISPSDPDRMTHGWSPLGTGCPVIVVAWPDGSKPVDPDPADQSPPDADPFAWEPA